MLKKDRLNIKDEKWVVKHLVFIKILTFWKPNWPDWDHISSQFGKSLIIGFGHRYKRRKRNHCHARFSDGTHTHDLIKIKPKMYRLKKTFNKPPASAFLVHCKSSQIGPKQDLKQIRIWQKGQKVIRHVWLSKCVKAVERKRFSEKKIRDWKWRLNYQLKWLSWWWICAIKMCMCVCFINLDWKKSLLEKKE